MALPNLKQEWLQDKGIGSFFRPQDLVPVGIGFGELQKLVDAGTVERLARGLYRLVNAKPTEHDSLAAVCARVPSAIVCLLSALTYYEIGTQMPTRIWIAIPHKARAPRLQGFPIRLVRFSGPALHYGIKSIRLEGVPARITSPARTVVDTFRFRRIVGRDVALEALRESLRERKVTADDIWRAAEMCRAKSVIKPYLEAMSV